MSVLYDVLKFETAAQNDRCVNMKANCEEYI
jgi:hypothetical protein